MSKEEALKLSIDDVWKSESFYLFIMISGIRSGTRDISNKNVIRFPLLLIFQNITLKVLEIVKTYFSSKLFILD